MRSLRRRRRRRRRIALPWRRGFTRRDAGDRVVLYLLYYYICARIINNNNIVEIDDVSVSTRNIIIIQQYNKIII